MTVREAFSLAFGPVPEGATCGCAGYTQYEGSDLGAYCFVDGDVFVFDDECGWTRSHHDRPDSPDISDRPASSFLGFFGDAYDKVAKETPDA